MRILEKLIEQAKKPRGLIGQIMISIMNNAHIRQSIWGVEKLNIKNDSTVLDIGCGGGKLVSYLCGKINQGKVIGIDYSNDAVNQTIHRNRRHIESGLAEVKCGSVLELPLKNGEVDFVLAVQTHYFWDDLEKSLTEIKRVLNGSGCVMILSELSKMEYHMRAYKTVASTKKLLDKLNYKNIRTYQNNGWMCIIGNAA